MTMHLDDTQYLAKLWLDRHVSSSVWMSINFKVLNWKLNRHIKFLLYISSVRFSSCISQLHVNMVTQSLNEWYFLNKKWTYFSVYLYTWIWYAKAFEEKKKLKKMSVIQFVRFSSISLTERNNIGTSLSCTDGNNWWVGLFCLQCL